MLASLRITAPTRLGIITGNIGRQVEQLKQDLSKEPPTQSAGFGEKLKQAIKRKLEARAGFKASASSQDDSFGQKLKEAVRRKQAPASKAREKEADRWRTAREKVKPRPHTKSD
jgi:flagellar hook-basal body complex protein FliE